MARARLDLNSYFGPYYLEKLIAVGGMAEIYLARTQGLAGFEKQLVLKVIQPDLADDDQFVQMLVDEAKIAVGLNHPNIAQTFDLGKIGGCYFISMEFVDGADFFQILRHLSEMEVDLPIEVAIYVVQEVLTGLDYAHKKADDQGNPLHIIHRDVSPQNILLSCHGEVKLVDFGIAKAANLSHKTRAGVIKGKLVYMSPEQAWGDTVDQRTDVFSGGIVLYEALTMGSLYLEDNPAKLLEAVRKAEIAPPSSRRKGIPAELDGLVMKALSPRPADRYSSAAEFAATLAGFLRRLAPDFSEQHLGGIVESVLSGEKPKLQGKPMVTSTGEMMVREDYAVQEHSMIFSAEDLLGSSGHLPSMAGRRPHDAVSKGAAGGSAAMIGRLLLLEDKEGEPYELGEQFILGRTGDLRLSDARVSRRHAAINRRNGSFLLEDLNSSNGTYLNGEKIGQPCVLKAGDIVRVGPFEMQFFLEQTPQPEAPPEHHEAPSVPDEPSVSQGPPSPKEEPEGQAVGADDGASVSIAVGPESLRIPVGESLRLAHSLCVGRARLEGEVAVVVRRTNGYWLEPAPGKQAVIHNGRKITVSTQLSSGDKVVVGPLQLEFHLEG
jgi:serine/threonine protein kinase